MGGGSCNLPVYGVDRAGVLHDTQPVPRHRVRGALVSPWDLDAHHTNVRLQSFRLHWKSKRADNLFSYLLVGMCS